MSEAYRRIEAGLKEAMAGDIAAVTIDGYRWVRRDAQAFDPATAAAPCQIDGCRYSAKDAEIERLKTALRQIDRLAYSHVKGAMQKAQQIARAALDGETPPTP